MSRLFFANSRIIRITETVLSGATIIGQLLPAGSKMLLARLAYPIQRPRTSLGAAGAARRVRRLSHAAVPRRTRVVAYPADRCVPAQAPRDARSQMRGAASDAGLAATSTVAQCP